jgi:hypothetical protein
MMFNEDSSFLVLEEKKHMRWLASRVFWGILLIAGGIIFLLQNLNLIAFGDLFWTVAFGLVGLAFLSVFLSDRRQWWALIPALVLFAIGAVILIDFAFPAVSGQLVGLIFLGGIGLSFILVYLVNRENWWAIIPGGVMLTLAVVTLVSNTASGFDTGGIFFLGIGLTFAVLGILPTQQGQLRWAFIPATVLILMGLILMAAFSSLVNYIWPVVIILVGLYLIFRTWMRSRA